MLLFRTHNRGESARADPLIVLISLHLEGVPKTAHQHGHDGPLTGTTILVDYRSVPGTFSLVSVHEDDDRYVLNVKSTLSAVVLMIVDAAHRHRFGDLLMFVGCRSWSAVIFSF